VIAKNAKQYLREEVIPALRERSPYFNVASIRRLLAEKNIHVKRETLNHYVCELRIDSQIYSAGRGWYSVIEQEFRLSSKPVAELVSSLEKHFPFLEYTCWSTQQINRFMHHLLAKYVQFVFTERDAMNSIFDYLNDAGYDAYLNPTRREANKSFSVTEKTVVIRPIITKSPVHGHLAPIEKILIDLNIELKAFQLMDHSEFRKMSQNLVSSERVVMSELLSYARRRKVALEDLFENSQSFISTFAR
jgi:hypothetical protein